MEYCRVQLQSWARWTFAKTALEIRTLNTAIEHHEEMGLQPDPKMIQPSLPDGVDWYVDAWHSLCRSRTDHGIPIGAIETYNRLFWQDNPFFLGEMDAFRVLFVFCGIIDAENAAAIQQRLELEKAKAAAKK